MSTSRALPFVAELDELLDDIREYKVIGGHHPKKKEDYLACPYERHGRSECMKRSTGDWVGLANLGRLM